MGEWVRVRREGWKRVRERNGGIIWRKGWKRGRVKERMGRRERKRYFKNLLPFFQFHIHLIHYYSTKSSFLSSFLWPVFDLRCVQRVIAVKASPPPRGVRAGQAVVTEEIKIPGDGVRRGLMEGMGWDGMERGKEEGWGGKGRYGEER
jgi:hypothetical protein